MGYQQDKSGILKVEEISAKEIMKIPRAFRSIVASGNIKILSQKLRADIADITSLKKIIAILKIPKLMIPAFPKKGETLKSFEKHLKKVKKYKKNKKLKKLEKITIRSKVEEIGPKEIMEVPKSFRSMVASSNLKMLTKKLEMDKTDRKSLKKAIAILQIPKLSMPAFQKKADLLKSFKKQLKKLRKRRRRRKLKKIKKQEKQKLTASAAEGKAEEEAIPEEKLDKASDVKVDGNVEEQPIAKEEPHQNDVLAADEKATPNEEPDNQPAKVTDEK